MAATITGPSAGMCSRPIRLQAEVDVEERLQHSRAPASRRTGWPPARARAGAALRDPSHIGVPALVRARYSWRALTPGIDRTRTLRGAVCGAVAAAVWALQQPLDKLALRQPATTTSSCSARRSSRGRRLVPGRVRAAHAERRRVRRRLRQRRAAAAAAAGAPRARSWRWPSTSRSGRSARCHDRLHPAREQLPRLAGNRRAFAQSTWRHLLFGLVLGELERRVNAEPEPAPPEPEADYSSNGHGSLEHARRSA